MKKVFFSFVAFLCVSFLNLAISQELYSKEYVVQKADNFSNFYSLDESTKQKVFYYVFENNEKVKLLNSEANDMLAEAFTENKKRLRIELETNLFTLLTPEQISQFESFAVQSPYF